MRLFCDENIMTETVAFLRSSGHDVASVREDGLSGAGDGEVLARAEQEDRALLTYNGDFSDLRGLAAGKHAGIIRLRVRDQTAEAVHPLIRDALGCLSGRDIHGKLVTVREHSVRIRGTL